MLVRFCLYSIFKNLRFADPYFVLYLLALGRSFTEIGLLLGYQHLLTVTMEVPSGFLADRCGRRLALVGCFLAYFACYALLGFCQLVVAAWQLPLLLAALTSFGIGEALRTGSHKAIMLDYLDLTGQPQRATEVIGLTRSYSKYSAGLSAICGGLILFLSQRFDVLFWLSALPAAAGVGLMFTYPRYWDGECARSKRGNGEGLIDWRGGLAAMFARPDVLALLWQSVLFESQIKVILEYYAQPMLKVGLARQGIQLTQTLRGGLIERSGALWIGCLEFLRESLGGIAARLSPRFEQSLASQARALDLCYLAALFLGLSLAALVCLVNDWLLLAIGVFVALTWLQNLRRPMFVSALNSDMEKSMRATILSMESVARSIVLAIMLPLMGLVADYWGVQYALALPPLLLLAGWPLTLRRRSLAASTVAQ